MCVGGGVGVSEKHRMAWRTFLFLTLKIDVALIISSDQLNNL